MEHGQLKSAPVQIAKVNGKSENNVMQLGKKNLKSVIRKSGSMNKVSEIVRKYVEITQLLAKEVENLKLENERKEQIILAQAETIRKLANE
jgi:hypothetical protein